MKLKQHFLTEKFMKPLHIIKRFQLHLGTLRLVDKCLLLFMTILMFQSMHNLLFHELIAQDSQSIDVVIRTLAASIFGYFISSNFQREDPARKNEPDNSAKNIQQPPQSQSTPNDRIRFQQVSSTLDLDNHKHEVDYIKNSYNQEKRIKQQIIIITTIGLLSLIILAIVHNLGHIPETALATVSQFRDFASGSIGFLVGYSKREK